MSEALPLAAHILLALAQEQGTRGDDAAVSLPRLSKALGLSASALMRELTLMSDAQIGAHRGPGWVTVSESEGRWRVALTPAGRAVLPE